jgi:hypothetical protein
MLWVDAVERGDLALPSTDEMDASRLRVRDWKRANMLGEPTSAYWVSTHLHNYLDVVQMEIGLRHRRKGNPLREWFGHYEVADFASLIEEYKSKRGTKRTALALDT